MSAPAETTHPVRLDTIPPEPIDWLWPGYLPRGKLTLLDGDPEAGKSLVTLDLAARLSAGLPWPDGQPAPQPASTLMLSAEDRPADTLRPRLSALHGDPARVWFFPPFTPGGRTSFLLPDRPEPLARALDESGARLLVLDPLTAFFGSRVVLGNEASVRAALASLDRLAIDYRCAVLLVRHLAKGGGARALYRGLGSIAIIGYCRFALMVAAHPHHPDRRVLTQLKTNLAGRRPTLTFSVRSTDDDPALPALTWHGPCTLRPDDLLATSRTAPTRSVAREFLLGFLHEGPRPSAAVTDEALALGLNPRTLQRAAEDLGILFARVRDNDRTIAYWRLPHHPPPPNACRTAEEILRPYMQPRTPHPQPDAPPNPQP